VKTVFSPFATEADEFSMFFVVSFPTKHRAGCKKSRQGDVVVTIAQGATKGKGQT